MLALGNSPCGLLLSRRNWRREGPLDLTPDGAVAFAGAFRERGPIDDLHAPTAVTDHAGALQEARCNRDRRAADGEYLAEKFLRQGDDIPLDTVVRLQKPPAKPRFQHVECIAGNGLLDLGKQKIIVPHDKAANSAAFPRGRLEMGTRNLCGGARKLNDGSGEGTTGPESRSRSNNALPPHHPGLDGRPALHDGHQRDHPAMRKIDMFD